MYCYTAGIRPVYSTSHGYGNCTTHSFPMTDMSKVEAHTAKDGWSTARHAWHPTTDIAVSSIPVLDHWARKLLLTTVLPSIADLFGFETRHLSTEGPASPSLAACLKDLFAVRYRPGTQDRLAPHRDGNLLSFNILLSEPGSFEGGGTRFAALQGMEGGSLGFCASDGVVRPSTVGDLTMHTGKLLHEGVRVTRGTRYILVGFVRVASPKVNQVCECHYTPTPSSRVCVFVSARFFALFFSRLFNPGLARMGRRLEA
ncbi:unnamed protein product [Choristocarpus tenellus]